MLFVTRRKRLSALLVTKFQATSDVEPHPEPVPVLVHELDTNLVMVLVIIPVISLGTHRDTWLLIFTAINPGRDLWCQTLQKLLVNFKTAQLSHRMALLWMLHAKILTEVLNNLAYSCTYPTPSDLQIIEDNDSRWEAHFGLQDDFVGKQSSVRVFKKGTNIIIEKKIPIPSDVQLATVSTYMKGKWSNHFIESV